MSSSGSTSRSRATVAGTSIASSWRTSISTPCISRTSSRIFSQRESVRLANTMPVKTSAFIAHLCATTPPTPPAPTITTLLIWGILSRRANELAGARGAELTTIFRGDKRKSTGEPSRRCHGRRRSATTALCRPAASSSETSATPWRPASPSGRSDRLLAPPVTRARARPARPRRRPTRARPGTGPPRPAGCPPSSSATAPP